MFHYVSNVSRFTEALYRTENVVTYFSVECQEKSFARYCLTISLIFLAILLLMGCNCTKSKHMIIFRLSLIELVYLVRWFEVIMAGPGMKSDFATRGRFVTIISCQQ